MNYDYLDYILGEDAKDEELIGIFERLDFYQTGAEVDEVLWTMSDMGRIERRSPNNYRRGEYTFISMLKHFGQEYVDSLEIVNNLNLSIFPILIRPFEYEDGSMVVAIKIPGNTGKDIEWGQSEDVYNLPEAAKQEAVTDLRKLEEAGYLLQPKFRFSVGVTPNGHVMIPDVPLVRKEDAQDIIDIYSRYNMFGWTHKRPFTRMFL